MTSVLPSQNPLVNVTGCCGPSALLRSGSSTGLPIVKVPGAIQTISRSRDATRKGWPGTNAVASEAVEALAAGLATTCESPATVKQGHAHAAEIAHAILTLGRIMGGEPKLALPGVQGMMLLRDVSFAALLALITKPGDFSWLVVAMQRKPRLNA